MKRSCSRFLTAALLSASTLYAGCYGSFSLTKKVHEWNGGVSGDKFVQWLVFLGLNVIPVYGVAVVVDALALNALEFWVGSNPVDGVATRVEPNQDGTMTVYRGDEVFRVVAVAPDAVEIYQNDQRVGVATVSAKGKLLVADESGIVKLDER